jgi:hypothetical protein
VNNPASTTKIKESIERAEETGKRKLALANISLKSVVEEEI